MIIEVGYIYCLSVIVLTNDEKVRVLWREVVNLVEWN